MPVLLPGHTIAGCFKAALCCNEQKYKEVTRSDVLSCFQIGNDASDY